MGVANVTFKIDLSYDLGIHNNCLFSSKPGQGSRFHPKRTRLLGVIFKKKEKKEEASRQIDRGGKKEKRKKEKRKRKEEAKNPIGRV